MFKEFSIFKKNIPIMISRHSVFKNTQKLLRLNIANNATMITGFEKAALLKQFAQALRTEPEKYKNIPRQLFTLLKKYNVSPTDEALFIEMWKNKEQYVRNLSKDEYAKNDLFNEEIGSTLKLGVTRKWGGRTLATSSTEWKKLRLEVIEREQNTCRFCGTKLAKYLVCDHINGNASDNRPENLGINCPLCDLIRHCGRAGVEDQLSLYRSRFSQTKIVHNSLKFFIDTGRVPYPNEIDPAAILVSETTVYFANQLLNTNYSELSEVERTEYKGFFKPNTYLIFKRVKDSLLEVPK